MQTLPPQTEVQQQTELPSKVDEIDVAIKDLREENHIRSCLPSFFNWLFRRQGVVNKLIIVSLEKLLRGQKKHYDDNNSELQRLKQDYEERFRTLNEQLIAERETRAELQHNLNELLKKTLSLQQLTSELATKSNQSQPIIGGLLNKASHFEKLIEGNEESIEMLRRTQDSDRNMSTLRFGEKQEAINETRETISKLNSELNNQHLKTVASFKSSIDSLEKQISNHTKHLKQIQHVDIYKCALNLRDLNSQLENLNLEKNKKHERNNQLKKIFDPFYKSFEEKYRGSREEISHRLEQYKDVVERVTNLHKQDATREPTLQAIDMGCGRGEWIELLSKRKFEAKGIDINEIFISECKSYNLEVIHQDALESIKEVESDTISIVSAFHLVEHLPFDYLIQLFQESYRALKKGGALLLETPNPENLLVSTHTFYLDPTHRNPLPPNLLVFCANHVGFNDVLIKPSGPYPKEQHISSKSPIGQKLNELLYGPQDYALIAYK